MLTMYKYTFYTLSVPCIPMGERLVRSTVALSAIKFFYVIQWKNFNERLILNGGHRDFDCKENTKLLEGDTSGCEMRERFRIDLQHLGEVTVKSNSTHRF